MRASRLVFVRPITVFGVDMVSVLKRSFFWLAAISAAVLLLFSSCAKKTQQNDLSGLSVVKTEGKYGYRGMVNGKLLVLDARYDFAYPFVEGLAVVELNRKMGYIDERIDETEKFVIEPRFDSAFNFSQGLARVRIGKKYGYINKMGTMVIGLDYDDAADFRNGIAKVRISNQVFYIDSSGHTATNVTDEISRGFAGRKNRY